MNESAAEMKKTPAKSTAAFEQPANAANSDEKDAFESKSTTDDEQPASASNSEKDPFEAMLDDLDDCSVYDEAETTDDECTIQELDVDQLSKTNIESKKWDLAPRTYTEEDFHPTTRDPRCKADWPLANFWPVYVGNFRLFRKRNPKYNYAHVIHKYFASKGLPSFMVFRLKDEFLTKYQRRVGLYDMLVYFCCRKDANRAMTWCHRDLYHGHRLNVYSGRSPIYFSTSKAVHFKPIKTKDMLATESKMERYVSTFVDVAAISKQDMDGVFVQCRESTRFTEFLGIDRYDCTRLAGRVQRQRFIERDVETEILQTIADNPEFMQCRLKKALLTILMHGVIPPFNRNWEKVKWLGARNQSQVNGKPSLNKTKATVAHTKRDKIMAVTADEWKLLQALRRSTSTKHSASLATSQPNKTNWNK